MPEFVIISDYSLSPKIEQWGPILMINGCRYVNPISSLIATKCEWQLCLSDRLFGVSTSGWNMRMPPPYLVPTIPYGFFY